MIFLEWRFPEQVLWSTTNTLLSFIFCCCYISEKERWTFNEDFAISTRGIESIVIFFFCFDHLRYVTFFQCFQNSSSQAAMMRYEEKKKTSTTLIGDQHTSRQNKMCEWKKTVFTIAISEVDVLIRSLALMKTTFGIGFWWWCSRGLRNADATFVCSIRPKLVINITDFFLLFRIDFLSTRLQQ